MAKRFTATEKWNDPWFCGLKPIDKLFWFYLIDNCDHAGIWQVNWPLVKFHLGIDNIDMIVFKERVQVISPETWFLPKFIEFQYNGILNPDNRTHASVIAILEKKGVYKGHTSPLQGAKDKGKVHVRFIAPTMEELLAYKKEISSPVDPLDFLDFYESKGWKVGRELMKDWKAAFRRAKNWEINRDKKNGTEKRMLQ